MSLQNIFSIRLDDKIQLVYADRKRGYELYANVVNGVRNFFTKDGSNTYHRVMNVYVVHNSVLAARFKIGDTVFSIKSYQSGEVIGINAMIIDDKAYLTYMLKLEDGTYDNIAAAGLFASMEESKYFNFSYTCAVDEFDGSVQNHVYTTGEYSIYDKGVAVSTADCDANYGGVSYDTSSVNGLGYYGNVSC